MLGERCRLSRSGVGRIERGEISRVARDDLVAVADVLGIRLGLDARWNGAGVDALLDRRHAATVEATVNLLRRLGWSTEVEVTFSEYGERGSIDVVGRHLPSGLLLVVEVEGSIGDLNQTVIGIDRKIRLMPAIGRQRRWAMTGVAGALVITEGSTNRDRIARHRSTFTSAFPAGGRSMRAWLRRPTLPPPRGLLFVRLRTARKVDFELQRVRTRRKNTDPSPRPSREGTRGAHGTDIPESGRSSTF